MDASFLSIVFLEWEQIYDMKNNFLLGYFENLQVADVIFIRMRLCLENTASIKLYEPWLEIKQIGTYQ